MASSDELLRFVREALAGGKSRGEVEDVLLRAGWSRDQVNGALAAYANVEFPIPVPRPKPYLSAREAFMYLLLFSMLYISAYHFGVLVFHYIDRAFPDAAVRAYEAYTRAAVRWALASLIVSFPVFVYLSALISRSVREDPVKRRSNVRRWLMYLTIFVAASVLIGDFITLVYNALGGELTTRFVLKVLAIGAIAGTIFGYYISDLRVEDTKPLAADPAWRRAIAGSATAAVVAVVVAGMVVLGSPSEERSRRLDGRRVDELREISDSVRVYMDRHKRLPSSLDELAAEGGLAVATRDPEVGAYEYRVTGQNTYELCATFQRESTPDFRATYGGFWSHRAGRQCFRLEAKSSS